MNKLHSIVFVLNDLICCVSQKPILDYLMEYRMLDEEEDHITRYLSRTILLQHYVAFRLALRKYV